MGAKRGQVATRGNAVAQPEAPVAAVSATAETIEGALALALVKATEAGRWDVVAQLARELEARRLEGSNVVGLEAGRAKKGGRRG